MYTWSEAIDLMEGLVAANSVRFFSLFSCCNATMDELQQYSVIMNLQTFSISTLSSSTLTLNRPIRNRFISMYHISSYLCEPTLSTAIASSLLWCPLITVAAAIEIAHYYSSVLTLYPIKPTTVDSIDPVIHFRLASCLQFQFTMHNVIAPQ